MKKFTEDFKSMITSMMDNMTITESSPDQKYSPNDQGTTNMVPDKRRAPPSDDGHYTKIGGMWTLKHDIG